jgi:hypothetical protein
MSTPAVVKARARKPNWIFVPIRILGITFLLTLFTFAVSLLLGISGVLVAATLHGHHPYMAEAYRDVAFPVAVTVGSIVLITVSVIEVRHYRQAKALASIENAS